MSDVEMYALSFRSVQGYRMCTADDPCSCGTSPMTYDGPQSECLVHGDSPEMCALLDVLAWDSSLDKSGFHTWDSDTRLAFPIELRLARNRMAREELTA